MNRLRPVLLLLTLAGCIKPDTAPRPAPDGDAALYASEVQPVVQRHCAFAGCHGREGMPLTLFAVDHLRLRDPRGAIDPTRPVLDERNLSPAEVQENRRALAARVTAADPTGDLVIRRLLSPREGGIPHAGVVVFTRSDDADLQALRRFLSSVHVP